MQIRKLFCLCIFSIAFSSCTKKENVLFHGRVALCDGTPLPNMQVSITRDYYKGHDDKQSIGSTITGADGFYALNEDVELPGKSGWYRVMLSDTLHLYLETNQTDPSDKNSNIQTDFILRNPYVAKCHIKNVSPSNDNDVFDSLTYYENALYRHIPIVYNLGGTSVDTTLIISIRAEKVDLEYTYTKNGITITKNDTLTPACSDTAYMDIFY